MSSPVHVAPATAGFVHALASRGHAVAVVHGRTSRSATATSPTASATTRPPSGGTPAGQRSTVGAAAARNDLDSLVFLAALAAGHPVLLGPGQPRRRRSADGRLRPRRRRGGRRHPGAAGRSGHDLHPDLALLLSTSGSTGSPKLVRLSHDNLQSNADAIAAYLDIRPTDRAVTTLPMHYCYGLSVINSHLLARRRAGAHRPVGRRRRASGTLFRARRRHELRRRAVHLRAARPRRLRRHGRCRHLRYVTQAGGRLAPERVRRYAELGRRQRLGPLRDVRADRGDRADGLPAAGPGAAAPAARSASPIPGGELAPRAVRRAPTATASASWSTAART